MELIISKVFNYTFITGFVLIILRAIVLLTKSKIERVLLSEEQKILVHVVRVLFLSMIITFAILQIIEFLSGESISEVNPDERLEIFIQLFFMGIMSSVIIYFYIPFILFVFRRKNKKYYIEHEKHGKLYVLKTANKDLILLSNKSYVDAEDGFVIFEKIERILSKPIFCEVNKYSLMDDLNNRKTKPKEV